VLTSSSNALHLRKFNTKRPKWISRGEFLPPQLQTLFELSYFQEDAAVPTGWNAVDGNRIFDKLSSRIPEEQSPIDQGTPGTWTNGGTDDDSSEEAPQPIAQTRMNDESSDEEVYQTHKASSSFLSHC
jgi:ubiquitin carboxyl-terminal hydrolase 4/11